MFGFIAGAAGVIRANLGGIKRAVGLAPKNPAPPPTPVERAGNLVTQVVERVGGPAIDRAGERAAGQFWRAPKTQLALWIGGGIGLAVVVLLLVLALRRR